MTKAMLAFSADPITYGHINLIERAARQFDEMVVGIGVNPEKVSKYLFSLEERTEMAKRALQHLPNVSVISFEGLLVDYAYLNKIPVLVKGLRDIRDLDDEKTQYYMGQAHQKGIETFPLICEKNQSFISSHSIKGIQAEHGATQLFVPLYVKQCLEAKMSGQYLVGLTGQIAVGKSTVTDALVAEGAKHGIQVYNLDLDAITHEIQDTNKELVYQDVRDEIIAEFGSEVANPDGTINRKMLGPKVFGNPQNLKRLNDIMSNPLLTIVRRELRGKKGIILINAALLIETEMTYLCNNNLILVDANTDSQRRRLVAKGHNPDEIKKRIESQLTYELKLEGIEKRIQEDRNGHVWIVENSDGIKPGIGALLDLIIAELKIK